MKTLSLAVLLAAASAARAAPVLHAVGIENEYADVIRQIGGPSVQVAAIESDPNTDPHSFEVSPSVASTLAGAALVVENGLGYDSWADRILSATPSAHRTLINVQHLLGLPDRTFNPHLWYQARTMPAVARAVADDLSALLPDQAAAFQARLAAFDASLETWTQSVASFRARFNGTRVAVTEPVADDLLLAAGCTIETPDSLQVAIMNGTDPSPQDVAVQRDLLRSRKVSVFAYNRQVTDSLTRSFLDLASKAGIPVIGVYETMPEPGFTYQSWMNAAMAALRRAVAEMPSSETLRAGR